MNININKKVKNIFVWWKIVAVLLIGILVVILVISSRDHKISISKKEEPTLYNDFLLEDPFFGLGGNYTREGSIGEPFYLGELVNRGLYKKPNRQKILEIVSVEKESGDKNNRVIKGGEKILLNILLKNPEKYPLTNIKIHGALKTLGGKENTPTKLLNDFFLITPTSLGLAGGTEKKISFPYTVPENIPPGNYSLDVGAVESNISRFLEGGSLVYRDPQWWSQKPRNYSFIFSVPDGDKSFGLVSKDGNLDFEMISNGNSFLLKNLQNIIIDPKVAVRFKMFNDSQEAKNFNVRYDLINFFGGIFADLDKDLDKIAERRSFTVKPGSTEEVLHEFNLEDYIKRAQKAFREKGFYGADNTFNASSLQVLIEGEGRKYIVYFPLFLEFNKYTACLTDFGINNFPIKKGETLDLFTGFYSIKLDNLFQDVQEKQALANENNLSRIELLLKDKDGGEVGKAVYVGKVDGVVKGWRNKIQAQKDLDYLELEAAVYSNQGKLERRIKEIYDCEKIEGSVCFHN